MNELIIDTIVFDYLTRNQQEISKKAISIMQDADIVYVCTSSIWELANHVRQGLIPLQTDFDLFYQTAIQKLGLTLLDTQWKALSYLSSFDYRIISKPYQKQINGKIISGIKQELHKDPFDRIIIAHGITMGLPVVSPDTFFPHYKSLGLTTVW